MGCDLSTGHWPGDSECGLQRDRIERRRDGRHLAGALVRRLTQPRVTKERAVERRPASHLKISPGVVALLQQVGFLARADVIVA